MVKNYTVDSILEVVKTGLEGEEATAFRAYCACELGALKALAGDDMFAGLKLKGKGDKAKGVYNGARVEFKGGHNAATIVLHFGAMILKESDSLGYLPPIVDMSQVCNAWAARRRATKPVEEKANA